MNRDRGREPGAAASAVTDRRLTARVAALEQAFDRVWRTRMQGLPVLNPALWVEAVDFARFGDEGRALGVLVTPWFMNLILLPSAAHAADDGASLDDWPVGMARPVDLGGEIFEFIGAADPVAGPFALCSLFSPMFEFASQTGARATAQAVLTSLRGAVDATARMGVVGAAGPGDAARAALGERPAAERNDRASERRPAALPDRRGFLFGRNQVPAGR